MPFEWPVGVTAGRLDVGNEAGVALVVVSSSKSCRYSDSAKSLPFTITGSIKARGVRNRILWEVGRWTKE
jgi:hypothetical protein